MRNLVRTILIGAVAALLAPAGADAREEDLFLAFVPDRPLPAPYGTLENCHADPGYARGTLGDLPAGQLCHAGLVGQLGVGVGNSTHEFAAAATAEFVSAPLAEDLVLLGPGSITAYLLAFQDIPFGGPGFYGRTGLGYWLHEVRPDGTFEWIGLGLAGGGFAGLGLGTKPYRHRAPFDVGPYTVAAGSRVRLYLLVDIDPGSCDPNEDWRECTDSLNLRQPTTAPQTRLLYGGIGKQAVFVHGLQGPVGVDYGGSGISFRVFRPDPPSGCETCDAPAPAPDADPAGPPADGTVGDTTVITPGDSDAVAHAPADDAGQPATGGGLSTLLLPLIALALSRRARPGQPRVRANSFMYSTSAFTPASGIAL